LLPDSGSEGCENRNAEADRDDTRELESVDPLAEEYVGGNDGEGCELRSENGTDRDGMAGADGKGRTLPGMIAQRTGSESLRRPVE